MKLRSAATTAGIGFVTVLLTTHCGPPKGSPDDVGGAQYSALEQEPVTTPTDSASKRADHALKTAFVIVMENKNWTSITGSPSAPFVNTSILPTAAMADNYRDNPKRVHPSEPNYIWMEAGDNLAIRDDDNPDENYRTTKKHLVSLLQAADVPWKSYQQGISGKVCPLANENAYAPKHNPMVFFTDVTDDNDAHSANCIEHVRPESELAADLANNAVSGYVFITPDLCHDMHDACASGNPIKNGDDFLATEIPMIQASQAYQDGGAIFITWDEGESADEPIGMVVLSPLAKTGYHTATAFNHSSLLRTMQEIFAVEPFLRDASNAQSLGELFTAYP
jgi:hypothetical protein